MVKKFLPARRSRKGKNFYHPKGNNFTFRRVRILFLPAPLGKNTILINFTMERTSISRNFSKLDVTKTILFHEIFTGRLRKIYICNLSEIREDVTYGFLNFMLKISSKAKGFFILHLISRKIPHMKLK